MSKKRKNEEGYCCWRNSHDLRRLSLHPGLGGNKVKGKCIQQYCIAGSDNHRATSYCAGCSSVFGIPVPICLRTDCYAKIHNNLDLQSQCYFLADYQELLRTKGLCTRSGSANVGNSVVVRKQSTGTSDSEEEVLGEEESEEDEDDEDSDEDAEEEVAVRTVPAIPAIPVRVSEQALLAIPVPVPVTVQRVNRSTRALVAASSTSSSSSGSSSSSSSTLSTPPVGHKNLQVAPVTQKKGLNGRRK